ncbi:uncharacterized protein ACHE_40142S [Aspergillus chevalieri]|uniref:Uncharacterized protein n=1 Tax=Aspergillus chevalieri TaxID=182096 RepID=A0A7R7VP63_ASPCH|nr:uncharacterized protein ACHE_40142S [Aspergillus chevalieri]BCR87578.1 hypothetical protein ACHE_40142S [Aspergillus chevalieri]
MHFYNEAKRLLNGQEVKPSITNLQGLGVVYTCACVCGKDRLGFILLGQMAEQVRHMMKFPDSIVAKADNQTENTARAVFLTIIGISSLLPEPPALPYKE